MARPRNFDEVKVIEHAMEAFWAHGYAGTSPESLAAATGIGKGSLYNAFGSKRDLFDRSLQRYDQLSGEAAAMYLDASSTAHECIGAFLHFLVDMDVQHPVRRGCLAVNTTVELAGHDTEILAVIRRMQDRSVTKLAARIDRGQRDGDVDHDLDPRALAEFLMNTIVGLRVMAKTHDGPALHRIVDTALNSLDPGSLGEPRPRERDLSSVQNEGKAVMHQTPVDQFVASYIAAWSTQDSDQRRKLIDQLYAEDAEFYADEPGDDPVQRHGRAEIMENITQVNQRLTQEAGLVTESTGFVENHDLLRVSWKMTSLDGSIAMVGMNVLIRNSGGEVVRDYILIG